MVRKRTKAQALGAHSLLESPSDSLQAPAEPLESVLQRTPWHKLPASSSVVSVGSDISWLRVLLASAELSDYFEEAAAWTGETGCTQSDLLGEADALQELIDHLQLKKFPSQRLRRAVAASGNRSACEDMQTDDASTAASSQGLMSKLLEAKAEAMPLAVEQRKATEDSIATFATTSQATEVLVADTKGKSGASKVKSRAADARASLEAVAAKEGTQIVSQRGKAREEIEIDADSKHGSIKQPLEARAVVNNVAKPAWEVVAKPSALPRKAALALAQGAQPQAAKTMLTQPESSVKKTQVTGTTPATARSKMSIADARVTLTAVAAKEATQMPTRTTKVREEIELEAWQVGRIIGPKGSTIKYIKDNFKVDADISQTSRAKPSIIIDGKKQNVEPAKAYIEQVLWFSWSC